MKENLCKKNRRLKSVYKVVLALVLGIVCQFFVMQKTYAGGEQLYFDEWGNLRMTTYDRIATSNITYKTIGWVIKQYDRPIGADNPNVVVVLEEDGAPQQDPANPAYQYCYFVCDKQDIFERIGDVSYQWQQDLYSNGGIVYLDAFMTVCINGVPQGGLLDGGNSAWGRVYNNFDTISTAENWADPEALRSHFDKQVYFPGNPALLNPYCSYKVNHCEYFDGSDQMWNLSRFGKDKQGQLNVWEEINVSPSDFSGYDFTYVSAKITKTYEDGRNEVMWTADYPIRIVNFGDGMTSISVDLYYKRGVKYEYLSDKFNMNDEKVVMDAQLLIQEGKAGQQTFDVLQAVPAGETLYIDGSINGMGYEVDYKNTHGYKSVPVIIGTVYQCQWTDASGNIQNEELLGLEYYYVDRPYSYWEIEDIQVHTLNSIEIENYVFDGEKVQISDLYQPNIVIEKKDSHLQEIPEAVHWVDGGVLYGEGAKPEFPYGKRQAEANSFVGNFMVNNDTFSIDDEVFLGGNTVTSYTGAPKLGSMGKRISVRKEDLTIPETKRNGFRYETKAVVNYQTYGTENMLKQDYWGVNPVTIHTPVVCQGFITDDKQYNQLCKPDKGLKTWILGRDFDIAISSEGEHMAYTGYGYQDYSRYVKAYQVRFPFEVYYGEVHYDSDVWIDYVEGKQFYLPTGVNEGKYTVTVRTLAKNYKEGDVENLSDCRNESLEHYAAYDNIDVVVSGRLYGLKVTNITGDNWKYVFGDKDGNATGYKYHIGLHNEDGQLSRRNPNTVFPILAGGNTYRPLWEGDAPGTVFSFEMETIGDYNSSEGIYIEPHFYMVDSDTGKNRKEVDIYHFYEKNGKEVWENISTHSESGMQYLKTDKRTDIGELVKNVSDNNVAKSSKQRWDSEFKIPKDIFVVPKDFDVKGYIKEKGMLDYSDDIFIKSGYIMVQFDIYTVKNGKKYLSYINEENAKSGYANMWKIEGFFTPRIKTNSKLFDMEFGDVFIYDLEKDGERNKVVGTH